MKYAVIAGAVLVLVLSMMATSSAADLSVSKMTISSMGFGSATVMSDQEGMAVRGKGGKFGGHHGHGGKGDCRPQPPCHPKHCASACNPHCKVR